MTNELLGRIYEDYLYTHAALLVSGVELAEDLINRNEIYYTYPEKYDDECGSIEDFEDDIKDDFKKMEYILGGIGLTGDPRQITQKIVKEYMLKLGVCMNPDMIDSWEEYQEFLKFYESDEFKQCVTIYSKPRDGVVWTKSDMLKGIEKTEEFMKAFINELGKRKGYKQV